MYKAGVKLSVKQHIRSTEAATEAAMEVIASTKATMEVVPTTEAAMGAVLTTMAVAAPKVDTEATPIAEPAPETTHFAEPATACIAEPALAAETTHVAEPATETIHVAEPVPGTTHVTEPPLPESAPGFPVGSCCEHVYGQREKHLNQVSALVLCKEKAFLASWENVVAFAMCCGLHGLWIMLIDFRQFFIRNYQTVCLSCLVLFTAWLNSCVCVVSF